jgi:hypothetical protein
VSPNPPALLPKRQLDCQDLIGLDNHIIGATIIKLLVRVLAVNNCQESAVSPFYLKEAL